MITGRTPGAATRAMRDALQPAVSSVSAAVVVVRADSVDNELRAAARLALPDGDRLSFSIRHFYNLISDVARTAHDRWEARAVGYEYRIDDADGRETVAYHWHPRGRSPVAQPHLHVGAGAGTVRAELQKAHLLTGFVTPVALLTLLLEAFAIRPRRPDWRAVLEAADRALAS